MWLCISMARVAQKLLAHTLGAPAQDTAMIGALVQLSSQVCSFMSELVAMLADAVAASLLSTNALESGDLLVCLLVCDRVSAMHV